MNKYVEFSNLGLGLFVHYGIYSVLGKGEWIKFSNNIQDDDYEKFICEFNPKINFTDGLCSFAKKNGFKYVVFTARHHDGFSLYNTNGLNEYDVYNYLNRDLVAEFISSCRKYDLKPFLYHTLIDWKMEKEFEKFSDYLEYLRNSIDIICSNYGELGGIWLDGEWQYKDRNWELDKLYKIIKNKQPRAYIINNNGMIGKNVKNSKYIDVVTYEKKNILDYNYHDMINSYAIEMCQTLNDHWGYTYDDINYKSVKDILTDFCTCRKYGGNYLLNIGPLSNGSIRDIEKNIINLFGRWVNLNKEAIYLPKPYYIELPDDCFALKHENIMYIYVMNVPMEYNDDEYCITINLKNLNYEKVVCMNENDKIVIDGQFIYVKPYSYGNSQIVKIIKIILNNN